MAFWDFLKGNTANDLPAIGRRLEELSQRVMNHNKRFRGGFISTTPDEYRQMVFQHDEVSGKDDLLYLSGLLSSISRENSEKSGIRKDLITGLFQSYPLAKAALTDDELYGLLYNWKQCGRNSSFQWSANKLLSLISKRIEQSGMTDTLKNCLLLLRSSEQNYHYSDQKKINQAVDYLLQDNSVIGVDRHDSWGPIVLKFLEQLNEPERKAWTNLLNHCLEAGDKGYPTKKWIEATKPLVECIDQVSFSGTLVQWLGFNKELLAAMHKQAGDAFTQSTSGFLRDINHNLLKSLIWCTGFVNDAALIAAVDAYAAIAYKKKPGVGSLSVRTGNACMYAFSLLPFKEAVTRLLKFRNRINNNSIIKSIDKMLTDVALKHGYEKDLLEEIGVMDFGLDEEGRKQIRFDDVICTIEALGTGEVIQNWSRDGKLLKAVPASVKTEHAAALKELKNEVKELEAQLSVQKSRIEDYYLSRKSWTWIDWQEHYLLHPLVRVVTRKLVWSFTENGQTTHGIPIGDGFVNLRGEALPFPGTDTSITLWHPISATVEEVVGWRNFIQEREITQPFKQVYREVYLLTEAEIRTESYSNRFAAHILRQHQFAALCRQRNWRFHLMGQWDSHNTPSVAIPNWQMSAQFYVDANGNGPANDLGIYLYIATDQVRFFRDGELLPLIDVPPLVFSEIMRDVDLFVGVCSIGNDPNWTDTGLEGYNTYWQEYSFGDLSESAKIRSEVLQRLIPRLRIADRCSFEGKFLKVRGKLRTYKIHMGSGNILMEPNDQYLCIVPAGRTEKDSERIFLPFEGDNLLSIIISKALMLAEDEKIRDETIVRQLK